jgi:hypothetical protein
MTENGRQQHYRSSCKPNRKFYIFWEVTVLLVLHMDGCTPILYTIQESVNPVFNFGLFFVVNYKKYKCICHISFHFSLLYLQKFYIKLQLKFKCDNLFYIFKKLICIFSLYWEIEISHIPTLTRWKFYNVMTCGFKRDFLHFNFGLFFVVNYKKYKCICHISFHFSLLYLQKLTKLLQLLNILVVINISPPDASINSLSYLGYVSSKWSLNLDK